MVAKRGLHIKSLKSNTRALRVGNFNEQFWILLVQVLYEFQRRFERLFRDAQYFGAWFLKTCAYSVRHEHPKSITKRSTEARRLTTRLN